MNPEICDLNPCAFDRPNLTDAQQDDLCPAVADQGPVKLIDLPALINVPRHTLQAWRVKWLEVELRWVRRNGYHAYRHLVFVASVDESKAIMVRE